MKILVNVYMLMIYSICHMFIHHLGSFVFDNLLHKQEASNPISTSPFTKDGAFGEDTTRLSLALFSMYIIKTIYLV